MFLSNIIDELIQSLLSFFNEAVMKMYFADQ